MEGLAGRLTHVLVEIRGVLGAFTAQAGHRRRGLEPQVADEAHLERHDEQLQVAQEAAVALRQEEGRTRDARHEDGNDRDRRPAKAADQQTVASRGHQHGQIDRQRGRQDLRAGRRGQLQRDPPGDAVDDDQSCSKTDDVSRARGGRHAVLAIRGSFYASLGGRARARQALECPP